MSTRRIRNWVTALFAPLAALGLAGCATTPPVSTGAGPALWLLSDKDTNIYLFGTIHLLPPGHQWRTPVIDHAIAASDELVLEMVMNKDPAAAAQTMSKLGTSPGLKPLMERIPEEKRPALRKIIATSQVPEQLFNRMEDWAAALTITAINFQGLGLDPDHGVENRLTSSYGSAKKPIFGLETAEEQFGLFDQLPKDEQYTLLLGTLDDPAQARALFAAMLQAWTKGDVEAIARSFNEDVNLSPFLQDRLLTQRNKHWAEWLEKRLDRPGTVLVAVGAGHLAGDHSVQHMLRQRGLKTRRLQ